MRNFFDNLKSGLTIGLGFLIMVIIGGTIYASLNLEEAQPGDTLTAEKWNTMTQKMNDLETVLNNQSLGLYPIGYIMMTTNPENPNSYLGYGTWEAWGEGKVLVGVNTEEEEFNSVEKTGGEKTHILTVNEMPSHNHSFSFGYPTGITTSSRKLGVNNQDERSLTNNTSFQGGNQSHNNLQPYITAYMWKRTN